MKKDRSISTTVNHLFRQEYGKMVAVLVKIFGTENLQMAEDVVQDALISALESWKFNGIPENPSGWMYRTAKNRAIDVIRKNRHSQTLDFSDPGRKLLTSEYTLSSKMDSLWNENHIQDDFLAMMYACCLPDISPQNQITFILKSLCGFSTKEVAKAFLTSEDTISKRLYRTKEFFRNNKIRPEIPSQKDISTRTGSVLSAIYLIFNEGYSATHSQEHIRDDLITQAMWLCRSLLENKRTKLPEVYALMALMCFHSSRTESRLSRDGELVLLNKQDRRKWDSELINLGSSYLNKASFGDALTTYHLEAAIAYEHCVSESYESTNWKAILLYYDQLLKILPDPVIALNRCMVILELNGPEAALKTLKKIKDRRQLENYYLYHSILGAIYQQLEEKVKASEHYRIALNLTESRHEQRLLKNKLTMVKASM